MEDKIAKELKGLMDEVVEGSELSKDIDALKAEAEAQKEANAKTLEDNTELKARLDSMQDKIVTLKQKTGVNQYVFKGYNPEMSKNFKSTLSTEEAEAVSKAMVEQIKRGESGSIYKAYDAANAIPVQYGSAVMGLAELTSTALQLANVVVADAPTIKYPVIGTRETVDAVNPGSANIEGSQTIEQLTFTIDKYVGTYINLLTSQVEDANFDIINSVVIPGQSAAIGQKYDAYMFNGGEFTSAIKDAPAGVIVSGAPAMAAAITFDNLNTLYHSVEWERGLLDCKWVGSRGVLKDVRGLKTTTGAAVFQETPILGKPSQTLMGSQFVVCPSIADVPADGAIRLCFGDFSKYWIFIRGSAVVSMVNPYILAKEHMVQLIASSRADGNIVDNATPGSSTAFTTLLRTD